MGPRGLKPFKLLARLYNYASAGYNVISSLLYVKKRKAFFDSSSLTPENVWTP